MPAGRPAKYKTAAEMQKAIDAYFDSCVEDQKHPTITGLAMGIGFVNRQSLLDYANKGEEFSDTVKKAKAKVEDHLEQSLYGGQVAGVIFNLKNNFGWKDKQEHEHTGKDGGPIVLWGKPSE